MYPFTKHQSTDMPPGGGPVEPQLDETSRALLVAAHRLLSEQGSQALTVRRIATEAGMSTMNVYSRFGGKDGVVDMLYIDGFERLFAAINAVETTDDVPADLVRVAHVYRDFALENPTYYGVMFRNSIENFTPSDRATGISLGGFSVFAERLRHGQTIGQIASGAGRSAPEIAAFLWATCHGMVSLELVGAASEVLSWSSIFDAGFRTAIAGLDPTVALAID